MTPQSKGRKKKHNERRRDLELSQRRHRVFLAWCQGKAMYVVAAEEGIHPSQITRDLDVVLADMAGRDLDDKKAAVFELLGKIAHGEAELLAAWERSKKNRERHKAKTVTKPGKGNAKGAKAPDGVTQEDRERITEGRDGNPRFWAELLDLWELKAKLLGILKNVHEHSGPAGAPIPLEVKEVVIRSRAEAIDVLSRLRQAGDVPGLN